jgi:hypothetical protein
MSPIEMWGSKRKIRSRHSAALPLSSSRMAFPRWRDEFLFVLEEGCDRERKPISAAAQAADAWRRESYPDPPDDRQDGWRGALARDRALGASKFDLERWQGEGPGLDTLLVGSAEKLQINVSRSKARSFSVVDWSKRIVDLVRNDITAYFRVRVHVRDATEERLVTLGVEDALVRVGHCIYAVCAQLPDKDKAHTVWSLKIDIVYDEDDEDDSDVVPANVGEKRCGSGSKRPSTKKKSAAIG